MLAGHIHKPLKVSITYLSASSTVPYHTVGTTAISTSNSSSGSSGIGDSQDPTTPSSPLGVSNSYWTLENIYNAYSMTSDGGVVKRSGSVSRSASASKTTSSSTASSIIKNTIEIWLPTSTPLLQVCKTAANYFLLPNRACIHMIDNMNNKKLLPFSVSTSITTRSGLFAVLPDLDTSKERNSDFATLMWSGGPLKTWNAKKVCKKSLLCCKNYYGESVMSSVECC